MEKPRISAGYWTRSNKRLEFFMDLLTLIVRPRDESPGPQRSGRSLQAVASYFKIVELSKRKLQKLSEPFSRRHHAGHRRISGFSSFRATGLGALRDCNARVDIQKIVRDLESQS